MITESTHIGTWGNDLALRLTKPLALRAGFSEGMPVQVTAESGRIVIETIAEPSLEQMLQAFDPQRHAGEAMADAPVGVETIR